MIKPVLDLKAFRAAASAFAAQLDQSPVPELFGATDGKRVGTYVEASFKEYLGRRYTVLVGNAAKGIDFPSLDVDLKVTSIAQPQSSCPFKDATQKVYGLGYSLLVVVYEKEDDQASRTAHLGVRHVIFIEAEHTGDFTLTKAIRRIVLDDDGALFGDEAEARTSEIDALLEDKNIPLDPLSRRTLAERIVNDPPAQGCLTISNALQWRLQYARAIALAGVGGIDGLVELHG